MCFRHLLSQFQDQPPAWQGKAPSLEKVVDELRAALTVASVTSDGNLIIPRDTDVQSVFPEVGTELAKTLTDLRAQFPPPSTAEAASPGKPEAQPKSAAGSKRFRCGLVSARGAWGFPERTVLDLLWAQRVPERPVMELLWARGGTGGRGESRDRRSAGSTRARSSSRRCRWRRPSTGPASTSSWLRPAAASATRAAWSCGFTTRRRRLARRLILQAGAVSANLFLGPPEP